MRATLQYRQTLVVFDQRHEDALGPIARAGRDGLTLGCAHRNSHAGDHAEPYASADRYTVTYSKPDRVANSGSHRDSLTHAVANRVTYPKPHRVTYPKPHSGRRRGDALD